MHTNRDKITFDSGPFSAQEAIVRSEQNALCFSISFIRMRFENEKLRNFVLQSVFIGWLTNKLLFLSL
jgi:hypothetical protein